jgi:4-hydroxythreonine-4-phosphate dehydrogenase
MSETKNTQNPSLPLIGFTLGDVNGIGPEILMRLLEDNRLLRICTPVIYGNHRILNRYRKLLQLEDFQMQPCRSANQALPRKINMLNCWEEDYEIKPGQADPEAGRLAWLALQKAGEDLASGDLQGLVTGPIQKSIMPAAEFPFPGQTEFFASLAQPQEGGKGGDKTRSLMMMVQDNFRVALASAHVAVEKVPGILTPNLLKSRIEQLDQILRSTFDIAKPRIAVLGLNPHAGEDGKIGLEEEKVIGPEIRRFRDKGQLVFGPFPSDGFFASGQQRKYDAVLAMYHDQGLIPFKLLAGMEGVNFTAGLPFFRVSPDHGTAYDIAGKGLASADSMRAALYLVLDLIRLKSEKVEQVIIPGKEKPAYRGRD